jgi:hypothetical protein
MDAINEAYGTPTLDDRDFQDNSYNALNNSEANGDSILTRVIRALKDCYWDIQDSDSDLDVIESPRFQKVTQLIRSAILQAETAFKEEKMKRGLQPDPFYGSRHGTDKREVERHRRNGDYRPTYDNSPWPHSRY